MKLKIEQLPNGDFEGELYFELRQSDGNFQVFSDGVRVGSTSKIKKLEDVKFDIYRVLMTDVMVYLLKKLEKQIGMGHLSIWRDGAWQHVNLLPDWHIE